MYRLSITSLLLFLLLLGVSAQEKKGFSYYDRLTYQAYLQGDWQQVIRLGREALHAGYDSYYLRMRLGIAFYNRHNYVRALHHFLKAQEFNEQDAVVRQYLYYCYLFLGREADRHALMHHMTVREREEVGAGKLTGLTLVALTADYFHTLDDQVTDGYDPTEVPGVDGYQSVTRRGGGASILFGHQTGENASLRYGYRFITKERFLFRRDVDGDLTLPDNTFTQHQLHGGLTLRLARGLTMDLSANYLNLRTTIPESFSYGNRISWVTLTSSDWTTQLLLQQELPYLTLYGGVGYAGMNDLNQIQAYSGMVFRPMGNTNFYFGGSLTWLRQGILSDPDLTRDDLIPSLILGGRLFGTLWTTAYLTPGNTSNYQSPGGWNLYNENNPVTLNISLEIDWIVPGNRMTLFLIPSWSRTESNYFPELDINGQGPDLEYDMLNFKFGLKWDL